MSAHLLKAEQAKRVGTTEAVHLKDNVSSLTLQMGHMIFQSVWLCLILFLGIEPFSQKNKNQKH